MRDAFLIGKSCYLQVHGRPAAEALQLVIVDLTTNDVVGHAGLGPINFFTRNAELTVEITNSAYLGKRYGKEATALLINHAFKKLNLHKVVMAMTEGCQASSQLFEELGFEKEAHLKEQLFIEGRFQDQLWYGLFQAEWLKKNS